MTGPVPAYRALRRRAQVPRRARLQEIFACTSTSRRVPAARELGYFRDRVDPTTAGRRDADDGQPENLRPGGDHVPDSQVMSDLDASVVFAETTARPTRAGRHHRLLLGGRITWSYALHNPKVKAGVACTAGSSRPPRRRCSPPTRWNSRRTSRRRCSACTAARTPAFRSRTWSRCARLKAAGNASQRDRGVRRRAATPSTRITADSETRASEDGWKRMQGGSRNTASPDTAAPA